MSIVETSSLIFPLDNVLKPPEAYHKSIWGDSFITVTPMASSQLEKIKKRIDELMDVIKKMIRDTSDLLQSLELIDAIHHLGVAYHFELEINDALKKLYEAGFEESNDLHITALGFRLLREQRFPISADIFSKFLNKDGDFKDSLKHNVKALLSLYDAAHLGTPSEKILENAAIFARTYLELLSTNMGTTDMDSTLATKIAEVLETPRFRRIERLEARKYLSIYEEEKNSNEVLLEFAKLDFQLVQSIHLEELRHITMWKNSVALTENLPFARDRFVEIHFWMVGAYFEPCYSRARIMATKSIILISILDDIYDQYGILEQLEVLTEIIDRWELKEDCPLPKFLQHYCNVLFQTYKDFEDELASEQNSFRVQFLRKEMMKLAHAYFNEMQWGNDHYVPNIEKHLSVSLRSSGCPLIFCASFIGIHEKVSPEVLSWVTGFPEIVKAHCFIGRVMNDITSDEHEKTDGHLASIVESYAKENKCTKEKACENLKTMVADAWKTINQEFLRTSLPLSFVRPIINLTRVLHHFYKDIDNYTHPFYSIKDNIGLVMMEPI